MKIYAPAPTEEESLEAHHNLHGSQGSYGVSKGESCLVLRGEKEARFPLELQK